MDAIVEVRLGPQGQKRYELVCDIASIRRFEQGHDIGIWELANQIQADKLPKHADIVRAFWAMARSQNVEWTLPMAAEWVRPSDYFKLLDAVARAINAALVDPDAKPPEQKQGGGEAVPTGASPTPSV